MNAKEMFEKLDCDYIDKSYDISFTFEQLKAINQQIKELGWYE